MTDVVERTRHGGHTVLWDPETVARLYDDEGMSAGEIANHIECGESTVRRWLDNHGISTQEADKPGASP